MITLRDYNHIKTANEAGLRFLGGPKEDRSIKAVCEHTWGLAAASSESRIMLFKINSDRFSFQSPEWKVYSKTWRKKLFPPRLVHTSRIVQRVLRVFSHAKNVQHFFKNGIKNTKELDITLI